MRERFLSFQLRSRRPQPRSLGHTVAGELFDRERNLVGITFPLDESKPVLSALVLRMKLFIAGRAGVACEVVFSIPPFVLRVFLHLPEKPVVVHDRPPGGVEHPTSLGKKARAVKPMKSQGDRNQANDSILKG